MSIHAASARTAGRISRKASDICIRLLLGTLLVFYFWMWAPSTGVAGEWFGPCPNGLITKPGNTTNYIFSEYMFGINTVIFCIYKD